MSEARPVDPEQAAEERARAALGRPLLGGQRRRCPRCGEAVAEPAPAACPRCLVGLPSAAAGRDLVPLDAPLTEMVRGAGCLLRGAGRLVATPALWKFAAVPLLVNLIAIGLAIWGGIELRGWISANTSAEALSDWTGILWGLLSYPVRFLGFLAEYLAPVLLPLLTAWLLVAFPLNLLYKLLTMPFMELLAEATDRALLGQRAEDGFSLDRFLRNLAVAILDAILLTGLQGLLFVLLLPLNLVPVLGNLLWLLLPPAIFAGMDYTDLDLVRRGYRTREKARLWRRYSWRFFGFGLSFCFLLTVPILNALVIPVAAVGGAILYLELEAK